MDENPADIFIRFLNDEVEKELLATPSANQCTVMKMVSSLRMEILQATLWGVRQESTPFPSNPYNASTSELEVFTRALSQARARQALDPQ